MTNEKEALTTPIVQKRTKLVPPDGGWGWMVLLGAATTNIFNQSMLSLFSLLYGDALESMGHHTTGAAIVMSTMLFVTNFGGPIAAVVMKLTSARFVAVTGACFCTAGLFFSGFSTKLVHLVLTYGILLGTGLGFIQNSSFVAINSYFVLRKSRAVGIANAGTGVGQTLMPHLVRYLLEHYGFQGTCLLLSGLSLHGIAGTLLIQPVEWHMKKIEEKVTEDEKLHLLHNKPNDILVRTESYKNGDTNHNGSRRSTEPCLTNQNGKREVYVDKKSNSYKELNNEKVARLSLKEVNDADRLARESPDENNNYVSAPVTKQQKSFLKKLYDLFDISLLASPRFLNVIIGTALAVTSIQNFSLLFPFFLQKAANMSKKETAFCMSAVASADIAGRLILPTIQDKYRIKARWMLIMTSTWLIVVRQILAYQTNLNILIVMSCFYGFGRSMIIVARNIAISDNCRLDQVPAAVGLGMLTMGIIVPPTGYFLGWIRDYTGSYITCITAQNILLVILLIAWIPDMLYLWMKEKKEKKKEADNIRLS